jgi:hypothetical protein
MLAGFGQSCCASAEKLGWGVLLAIGLTTLGFVTVPLFSVMLTAPVLPFHVNWTGTPVTIPDQESSVKLRLLAALTMAPQRNEMYKRIMARLA